MRNIRVARSETETDLWSKINALFLHGYKIKLVLLYNQFVVQQNLPHVSVFLCTLLLFLILGFSETLLDIRGLFGFLTGAPLNSKATQTIMKD